VRNEWFLASASRVVGGYANRKLASLPARFPPPLFFVRFDHLWKPGSPFTKAGQLAYRPPHVVRDPSAPTTKIKCVPSPPSGGTLPPAIMIRKTLRCRFRVPFPPRGRSPQTPPPSRIGCTALRLGPGWGTFAFAYPPLATAPSPPSLFCGTTFFFNSFWDQNRQGKQIHTHWIKYQLCFFVPRFTIPAREK